MTDKTDALRARELLAAEYTKRGMGVDFVNDAGTPTSIALAAIREALAAPAGGGQGEVVDLGEVIREKVREHGSYRAASKAIGVNYPYLCQLAHDPSRKPSKEILAALGLERVTVTRRLIDSAGGAKCGTCHETIRADSLTGTTCACAPQPAEGDEAVAWRCVNGYSDCWGPKSAKCCPDCQHRTRPAAAAVVPDEVRALPERWRAKKCGLSALGCANELAHAIAAAPVAPKCCNCLGIDPGSCAFNCTPAAPKGGDEAEAAYLQSLGDDPALDGWYPEPLPARKQADPPPANACATFLRDFIAEYEEHEEDEWSASWQGLADRARALANQEQQP